MKKLFNVTLLLFLSLGTMAQQVPFHKQYYVNPFVVNPSQAGIGEQMNLFLMHRAQWVSIPGSPVTSTLTFDTPLKVGKSGAGISFFTDQTDIFRRTGGSAAYAHQFNFGANTNLRLGLAANVFDNKIDFSKVVVLQEGDPYVFQTPQNKPIVDGTAGLTFTFRDLQLGGVVNHGGANLLNYRDNDNEANYVQEMFYQGSLKYKFKLDKARNIYAYPLVMVRYFNDAPLQYDLNGVISYDDKFWVAGTYRSDYGVSIAAGFKAYNILTIGYSYDIVTNSLKGIAGMSSEIIVGLKLGRNQEQKKAEFIDTDNDGVADEFDLEPDSDSSAFVNFQGRTIADNLPDLDTVIIKETIYIDSSTNTVVQGSGGPAIAESMQSFYFDVNQSNFKPGQEEKFVALAALVKENPESVVLITGNTDARGSDAYNLTLGQKRAESIAKHLIDNFGVDPMNITSVMSKGKSDLLSKSKDFLNRRVDVFILPGDSEKAKTKAAQKPTPSNDEGGITKPVKTNAEKEAPVTSPTSTKVVKPSDIESMIEPSLPENKLFFTIQLGVFANRLPEGYWKVDKVNELENNDGSIRYYRGIYHSESEADAYLEEINNAGYKDAYITAYFNGERLSLQEAKKLLKARGSSILRDKE
ncbi:MAG: type IX secretion system PorP/SprF family membrane protein [Lentimonas sp.]|jgi:type IX secretion system PorP/SprF family membrane protein